MCRDYFLGARVLLFMTKEEAVGKKFNKLTITGWKRSENNGYKIIAQCVCECGVPIDVFMSNVVRGHTKSCGCHKVSMKGKCHLTHGKSRGKTYRIFAGMKSRCLNPNEKAYPDYGGRGIKICERWLGKGGFLNFLEDMGECPLGYSIERKNVNGNYEPGNCLWIPRTNQAKNRRDTIWITLNGETKTLTDWCEIKQTPWSRIHSRISNGWPTEMLFEPKGTVRKNVNRNFTPSPQT